MKHFKVANQDVVFEMEPEVAQEFLVKGWSVSGASGGV